MLPLVAWEKKENRWRCDDQLITIQSLCEESLRNHDLSNVRRIKLIDAPQESMLLLMAVWSKEPLNLRVLEFGTIGIQNVFQCTLTLSGLEYLSIDNILVMKGDRPMARGEDVVEISLLFHTPALRRVYLGK